ncbi:MAG: endo-1,4-beta-xylanase [Candidatus Binatia bacterium]
MSCGDGGESSAGGLRTLAASSGRSIGSAAHDEHLVDDPEYGTVLAREFESLTPYTAMKGGRIHPEPERYDFSGADMLVDFARAHRMRVRGHTLVWGGASDPPNPAYVKGAASPAALRALMTDHIETVMRRYAGRVDRWDVVNEPLTSLGEAGGTDGLRDHVFLQQLGAGYIAEALALAHRVDPAARLFVNDVFVLKPGAKQERYFRLVRELLEAKVPLHGVGFQGHLAFLPIALPGDADVPTAAEIEATLRRFAALGVDVEITELNVHTWRFDGDRAARLEQQRQLYESAVRACVAVPRCTAVTVWLFTDRYPTSLEAVLGRDGEPLLFDDDYAPKPAYYGVRDALRDGARR